MPRAAGVPNTLPSQEQQKFYLRRLRRLADAGDVNATGWLLWISAVNKPNRAKEA